jgi:uncharacterized protein YdiU (UPF0061 family)
MKEIEDYEKFKSEIEVKYPKLKEGGTQAFNVWIKQYKTLLNKSSMEDSDRKTIMEKANPAFILRNYLLQEAIEKAEKGDFSMV